MIIKLVLFGLLAASPVLGSAIKGYRDELPSGPLQAKGYREELPPIKGGRLSAQIEQQKVLVEQKLETSAVEKKVEHIREEQQQLSEPQQKLEDLKQEHEPEPQVQRVEEAPAAPTKSAHYDARPQIVRQEEHELAKGQSEQKLLVEQAVQRVEEAPRVKAPAPLEAQKPYEVERVEQVQRDSTNYESQQVELREEQQRYEPNTEQRRLEDTQQVEEFQQQQVVQYPVKGAQPSAPLGQAEPYAFEYSVEGSARRESGDTNGVVRGQYTLQGADGSSRIVDYVADANGFRASVNTNEFGTEARSPAAVDLRSSQPEAQDISLRLEGKTRESLQAPKAPVVPKAQPVPSKPENWQVKGQAPIVAQLPQLVLAPSEPLEAPRAVAATKSVQQLKTQAPQVRAPAKGEVEVRQQVELISQASGAGQIESIDRRAPSAEYRAPKALVRAAQVPGFVSATAHQQVRPVERRPVYSAPQTLGHVATSGIIGTRPVAPVRSYPRQVPSRSHNYQVDRHYPSSSISGYVPALGYRRPIFVNPSSSSSLVAASIGEPRGLNIEDDSLIANFDRSA